MLVGSALGRPAALCVILFIVVRAKAQPPSQARSVTPVPTPAPQACGKGTTCSTARCPAAKPHPYGHSSAGIFCCGTDTPDPGNCPSSDECCLSPPTNPQFVPQCTHCGTCWPKSTVVSTATCCSYYPSTGQCYGWCEPIPTLTPTPLPPTPAPTPVPTPAPQACGMGTVCSTARCPAATPYPYGHAADGIFCCSTQPDGRGHCLSADECCLNPPTDSQCMPQCTIEGTCWPKSTVASTATCCSYDPSTGQ